VKDRSKQPPPVKTEEQSKVPGELLPGVPRKLTPDPSRITLTNEVELEQARLKSSLLSSLPPPAGRPSGEQNLLSLANAQAPTVPPPAHPESSPMAITAENPALDLDALPLPEAPAEEPTGSSPLVEMRDRFSLGDYTGALQLAESILEEDPRHIEASECAEDCRVVLIKMYSAKIGPLDKVPVVMVPRAQLKWLSIDHRAGFVLSHIDGTSNLEMILDVSGMPPLDALRILYELVQQKIISFR
jgi:hypothetical protein